MGKRMKPSRTPFTGKATYCTGPGRSGAADLAGETGHSPDVLEGRVRRTMAKPSTQMETKPQPQASPKPGEPKAPRAEDMIFDIRKIDTDPLRKLRH